jgi:hypothetical protein
MKYEALIKNYMKTNLGTNPAWALKGLVEIFNRQTADEQSSDNTCHNNSVGFSGVDAPFLSSLAKQYQSRGSLSPKQMVHVFKKMPRYWSQLWSLIPAEKQAAIIVKLTSEKTEEKLVVA